MHLVDININIKYSTIKYTYQNSHFGPPVLWEWWEASGGRVQGLDIRYWPGVSTSPAQPLTRHLSDVTAQPPGDTTWQITRDMCEAEEQQSGPSLFDIRRYPSIVICGRLAGVWLASVNEAVFGVIIFLLSSYYLIIILLSGVMASIHHTSSHCSHYSQGPPSSCRLMAQLTRMRSCAVRRTPGNLWSLWFHPSQEMWPDFIYSSGHEVAGSWKIVQATHSQTQLELQLRTETKKMECWPQSCAVAVVSSISGGARGWSPESRGWAVWCRGRWRWRTCSPGATLYSGYTGAGPVSWLHSAAHCTVMPTPRHHSCNVDFVLQKNWNVV